MTCKMLPHTGYTMALFQILAFYTVYMRHPTWATPMHANKLTHPNKQLYTIHIK